MLVRELMSTPVVTVPLDASLRDAVGAMLEAGVGSVVLVEGDPASPTAILTDSDVLRGTYDRREPLDAIPARSVASSPLETIQPDRTVGTAVDRMREAGITHLPVVEDLNVVGMVTLTDVAVHHDDVRDEALSLGGRRGEWAGDGE